MALLRFLIYILIFIYPVLELGKISIRESISFSINDIIVGFILVTWISLRIQKKVKEGKLFKPIIIFITACIASLLLNTYKYNLDELFTASLYLIRWISYAAIYLAVIGFQKNTKTTLSKLMIIAGLIILLIGYLQFIFYQDLGNLFYLNWDKHLYRLFGTFFDPNFAGLFFVLFIIFIAGQYLIEKNKKNRMILILLLFFSLFAVVLTYSRSALLMLIISVFIFLFLLKKTKIIYVFSFFLILLILFSPKAFQTEGTNLFRINSSVERIKSIQAATDIFMKNPLIGVGFNAYRYSQFKHGYLSGEKWLTSHSGSGVDNSFLFILATTGIIGFAAYIYLLKKIFCLYLEKITKKNKINKIVVISSLSGILVSSLFINSLFYPPIMIWMWLIIGITENN